MTEEQINRRIEDATRLVETMDERTRMLVFEAGLYNEEQS